MPCAPGARGGVIGGHHGSHTVDAPEGGGPQPRPHTAAGNSWRPGCVCPAPCPAIPTDSQATTRYGPSGWTDPRRPPGATSGAPCPAPQSNLSFGPN